MIQRADRPALPGKSPTEIQSHVFNFQHIDSHITTFTSAVNQALWWKVVYLYVRFRAMTSLDAGAGNGNTALCALWGPQ